MAPLAAVAHSDREDGREIFDQIDAQFQLDDARLASITQEFLADMHVGLSKYNHPMAMMYVQTRTRPCLTC